MRSLKRTSVVRSPASTAERAALTRRTASRSCLASETASQRRTEIAAISESTDVGTTTQTINSIESLIFKSLSSHL
jgi:hypothetical protein